MGVEMLDRVYVIIIPTTFERLHIRSAIGVDSNQWPSLAGDRARRQITSQPTDKSGGGRSRDRTGLRPKIPVRRQIKRENSPI
jgi:hypothetical protein